MEKKSLSYAVVADAGNREGWHSAKQLCLETKKQGRPPEEKTGPKEGTRNPDWAMGENRETGLYYREIPTTCLDRSVEHHL